MAELADGVIVGSRDGAGGRRGRRGGGRDGRGRAGRRAALTRYGMPAGPVGRVPRIMGETRTISARKGTEAESAPASKPQRTRITKRKAIENHARSYFEALAAATPTACSRTGARTAWSTSSRSGSCAGASEIGGFFRGLFAAFPTSRRRSARGRRARTWRRSNGAWRGNFTGAPFRASRHRPADRHARHRPDRDRGRQERRATPPTTTAWRSRAQVGMLPAAGLGRRAGDEGRLQRRHQGAARRRPRLATRRRALTLRYRSRLIVYVTLVSAWSGGSPPGPSGSRRSTPSCSRPRW